VGWRGQDNVCGIAVGYLFFYGYLTRVVPSEVPSPSTRPARAGSRP
jgi:hypothetical protein